MQIKNFQYSGILFLFSLLAAAAMFFNLGAAQLGLKTPEWCDSTTGIISCLAVANSKWSSVGGIPLVFFGLSYLSLSVIGLIFLKFNFGAFTQRFRPLILAAGLSSLILLIIQFAFIRRLCPGCVILDLYFIGVAFLSRKHEKNYCTSLLISFSLIIAGAIGWQRLMTPIWETSLTDLKSLESGWAELSTKPKPRLELTVFHLGDTSSRSSRKILMILDPRCQFCSETLLTLDQVGKKLSLATSVQIIWRPADPECNEDSIQGHEGGCFLSKLFMCLPAGAQVSSYRELHNRPALGAGDLLETKKMSLESYPKLSKDVENCIYNSRLKLSQHVQIANSLTTLTPVTWVAGLKVIGTIDQQKWIYLLTKDRRKL